MTVIGRILDRVVEFCSLAFAPQSLIYFLSLGGCTIIFFLVFVVVYATLLEKRTNGVFAFFYFLVAFFVCLNISYFTLAVASSLESPQLPNLKRNATIAIEKEVKASEVRLDALREDLDFSR
jgi:hypothetical protein